MKPLRIAMWSGPRNISTAMMRAWENRPDTVVWDEPFYGDYLRKTGLDHPMRDDILRTCENDWQTVTAQLTGPVPNDKPIYFQKHMTQHMLPHIDRRWMAEVSNCFLIRSPEQVIASYAAKRGTVTYEDIGFGLQAELFDDVCQMTGKVPPVLDARDVLTNPGGMLRTLCSELDIEFSDQMLNWPAGRRESDGIWAAHWYHAVEGSTEFAPYAPKNISLSTAHKALAKRADRAYQTLYRHRIKPLQA